MGLVKPEPIKAMGRFVHEAVTIDPYTGIVYLTEDTSDGLIYRYIPREPSRLIKGGRLQALVVKDHSSLNTSNAVDPDGLNDTNEPKGPNVPLNESMAVDWIDLDDIQSPKNDLRHRGGTQGAARFARGEGIFFGRNCVFFVCTAGGKNRMGQVWRYLPSNREGHPEERAKPGQLELFIEPNDQTMLENGDNITVAPWGDLVICEDGPNEQFLVGVTPTGQIYKIAQNVMNHSEFAGSTFSPDGSTLFINVQTPGLTIAITGPWPGRA